MHDIRFRGFHPNENGEEKVFINGEWIKGFWVYGYYASKKETTYAFKEDYEKYPVKTEHFILKEEMTDWGLPNRLVCYPVIPETVGQYTGLKDKNNKKIYKGDILKGESYPFCSDGLYNYFAEVVWFDDSPAFGLYTFKNPNAKVKGISEGNCEYMEDFESNVWEIIGNIYENSELLNA